MKKIGLFLFVFIVGCAQVVRLPSDFESVTSKLNTPQLIDEYQRANFSYAQTWQGYGCGGVDISESSVACPPEYIFKTKKGNCAASAVFAVYCLKKAGYEAYVLKISVDTGSVKPGTRMSSNGKTWVAADYHYMAVYKDQGQWWIMDNGRFRPQGINGPFNVSEDIPYKILDIEKLKEP